MKSASERPATKRVRRQTARVWLALALFRALSASAGDAADSPWDVHFFGTLGVATSSDDQAEFVRDLSQPDGVAGGDWSAKLDSMLGLQASYAFTPGLEGTAQVVSRYRHDGSWTPEVSWAFLNYAPDPGTHLRLGRMGTDFYFLADSRFVGYSYLPVRPSGDYFGSLPFFRLDGFDASRAWTLGDGLLRGKVFAGISGGKGPSEQYQWDLDDSPMLGGNLSYQEGAWTFRVGYARLRHAHDLPLRESLLGQGVPAPIAEAAASALSVTDKWSGFYSVDAVYDQGPLQVQLSLSKVGQDNPFFQDTYAGYLLAGYRVGELTPFAGYSWAHSAQQTVTTGNAFADPVIAIITPWTHTHQHTYTLGLRWDFRRNMDLKLQWDAIRGRPESVMPYRWETAAWRGKTDVFSLTLDFAF